MNNQLYSRYYNHSLEGIKNISWCQIVLPIAHHSFQFPRVPPFLAIGINLSQLLERRLEFGNIARILYISHTLQIKYYAIPQSRSMQNPP